MTRRKPEAALTWVLKRLRMEADGPLIPSGRSRVALPFESRCEFSRIDDEPMVIVVNMDLALAGDCPAGVPKIEASGEGWFRFPVEPNYDAGMGDRLSETLFKAIVDFTYEPFKLAMPPGLAVERRHWKGDGGVECELESLTPTLIDFKVADSLGDNPPAGRLDFSLEGDVRTPSDDGGFTGAHLFRIGAPDLPPLCLRIEAASAWSFPRYAPSDRGWRLRFLETFKPDLLPLLSPFAEHLCSVAGLNVALQGLAPAGPENRPGSKR